MPCDQLVHCGNYTVLCLRVGEIHEYRNDGQGVILKARETPSCMNWHKSHGDTAGSTL